MVERFKIEISQTVLDDLRERLARTRWPLDFANDDWGYGANTAFIRSLVDHWLNDYDWRERERRMNDFAHFRTQVDGLPIHFIHAPGKGPDPIPLMLNHGWPWTFWDYQKLIGPLTDPAAYGGEAADSFTIVAPSLPGYGFSTPMNRPGMNFWRTADLWVALMEQLGYARFAAQGADWGAFVAAQLGHKYADRLLGIHIQIHLPLDLFSGGDIPIDDFGPEDQDRLARNITFRDNEFGYFALQSTKPQTPAIALNDSPAGLLAWIVEKRRSWSDCDGDVLTRFSKDDLIDTAMLYWVTESFGTSARYYYEAAHQPWQPSHNRMPVVEAEVSAAIFPREVIGAPRRWAERYYNLHRWTPMPAGGHFGPMEEPAALVDDIRAAFRHRR